MSLHNLRQFRRLHIRILQKPLKNGLASEATKKSPVSASSAATASPARAFSPLTDKKEEAAKSSPSPANMASSKSDLNVVVDASSPGFVKIPASITKIDTVKDIGTSLAFTDIPGPHSLRIFAKILSYMPIVGHKFTHETIQYILSAATLYIGSQLTWGSNIWLFNRMIGGYGPVVRIYGPFGGNIVLLSRPEHAQIVFDNEGPYPVRAFMDSIEKYRLQYRKNRHSGPFLTYGPEWQKLRKAIEEPLQLCLPKQAEKINKISNEFISRIITIRNSQEEVPPNFMQEMNKWALECFSLIALNRRLGFLDPCGLSTISDPGRLLSALEGATTAVRKCEWGVHLWRIIETPAWKSLVKNCDTIDGIFSKYIHRAEESLRSRASSGSTQDISILESILLREGMTAEDTMTILLDMMLIGVNATAFTAAFLLYHLAKAPRCQVKVSNEVEQLPENITVEHVKSMPYLQACIKETLRLKPPIPILNRKLTKDIVVHNYSIPKDTYILMPMHLSSMREEHFEDAHKFKPERWLPESNIEVKPYSLVSFGYGPRACFGKALAEFQVGVLVAKVLKKFSIEYYYRDIDSTHTILAAPTGPLRFKFTNKK